MKDDLPTLRKRIEDLRKSIHWKGMRQFCDTNLRKQQQLKDLEKELNEQISKK
jgi:hypothetical protein